MSSNDPLTNWGEREGKAGYGQAAVLLLMQPCNAGTLLFPFDNRQAVSQVYASLVSHICTWHGHCTSTSAMGVCTRSEEDARGGTRRQRELDPVENQNGGQAKAFTYGLDPERSISGIKTK